MQHLIGIVVPTFNRKEITINFVSQLYSQSYSFWELVVCDSGSTDGTVEELKDFNQVTLIDVGINNWWTGAVNIGMEHAIRQQKYNYIVIMNDDLLLERDFLEKIINSINVCPNALHTTRQVNHSGFEYYGHLHRGLCLIPYSVQYHDLKIGLTPIDFGNGCCIASTPDIFSRLFPLDDFLVPHLSGDVYIYLMAIRRGISTYVNKRITLIQTSSTDYFARTNIRNFLWFKGSPFHLASYLTIGYLRFNGVIGFLLFGWFYHYSYLRGLAKFLALHICGMI